jgi:predicted metal-dependent peptidase
VAEHRVRRALSRLVEYAPATGGLALWVLHRDTADPAAPPLATDGRTLSYGPGFAGLPLEQQTGLVAHTVLHVALRHAQRFLALQSRLGDADLGLFNACADAIVNSTLAHLAWLELPEGAVDLPTLLRNTLAIDAAPETALLEWDVERLYRTLDDRDRTRRRDGPRAAHVRRLHRAEHADLRPDPAERGAPEREAELTREWRERVVRAHAGDGEFSLLRRLVADLPRTRTPWEQVLRTRLARGLAPRPEPSWSRPARSWIANQGRGGPGRRMPWEPGSTVGRRVPRLALVVDVSGSIDAVLLERFAREIAAIARRQDSELVLVAGDDSVRLVRRFEPGNADLGGLTVQGGGGTDFTPLLEEADRHRPDIGVVLTDLEGPARFRPRWPVIWAIPEGRPAVAPFGSRLELD